MLEMPKHLETNNHTSNAASSQRSACLRAWNLKILSHSFFILFIREEKVVMALMLVAYALAGLALGARTLNPPMLDRLPAGAIVPHGWLKDEAMLMSTGYVCFFVAE